MVLYLPFLYVSYSPLWWYIVPSSMLAKAIIDHIFVQRAEKALANSRTSGIDADTNLFVIAAYTKEFTTVCLWALFLLLGNDADFTHVGIGYLLLCWLSLMLSAAWFLDVAQTFIVTCYV